METRAARVTEYVSERGSLRLTCLFGAGAGEPIVAPHILATAHIASCRPLHTFHDEAALCNRRIGSSNAPRILVTRVWVLYTSVAGCLLSATRTRPPILSTLDCFRAALPRTLSWSWAVRRVCCAGHGGTEKAAAASKDRLGYDSSTRPCASTGSLPQGTGSERRRHSSGKTPIANIVSSSRCVGATTTRGRHQHPRSVRGAAPLARNDPISAVAGS